MTFWPLFVVYSFQLHHSHLIFIQHLIAIILTTWSCWYCIQPGLTGPLLIGGYGPDTTRLEAGFWVHFEFLIFALYIFVNNNKKYSYQKLKNAKFEISILVYLYYPFGSWPLGSLLIFNICSHIFVNNNKKIILEIHKFEIRN